ncbi:tRNA (adenine(58)-N(1))-methyltransferase non-catalytic subunit TRM6-like [Diadema setosum]|uniref:tRNA (adenine(58)-N(1))-methyltransferase non-catalytic subunit TRM6-like n=1 Tax=Diadema setosum TaxID=31175 RepID=UPI003B3BD654
MDNRDTITEGANVILQKGKNMKVYKVLRKNKVFLDKRHFALDPIIGHPYGSSWELQGRGLVPVSGEKESHDIAGKIDEGGADNRAIVDDMTSQKLGKEDITNLKEQGKTGQEIIDHLVENSSSFNERTVFSKAKYLKKKQDKHIMRFVVLRPSTRLLCQLYFNKAPSKHIQLRIDTLAQILSATNVQSGSKVMMAEHCQGLLVGAVVERLAGLGSIVQFHSEDFPAHTALNAYNFSKQSREVLHTFPLKDVYQHLLKDTTEEEERTGQCVAGVRNDDEDAAGSVAMETDAAERTRDEAEVDSAEGRMPSLAEDVVSSSVPASSKDAGMMDASCEGVDDENSSSPEDKDDGVKTESSAKKSHPHRVQDEMKLERRRRRLEAMTKMKDLLLKRDMDTLLLVCKFHPAELLMALIDFLALSRPFAVYSPFKEPLVDCYVKLRDRGGVINIRLTETWLRDYQVLPDRTHPMINMSGTGGYLLTGIVVGK